MGETGKVVTRPRPIEVPPEGLHFGMEVGRSVRDTADADETQAPAPRPLHAMYGFAAGLYASQGLDPVELIRQLRDERDER